MTANILSKYENIILGTGNVLAKEEYKKANSPTHEMMICVKSKINDLKPQSFPDQRDFISLETEIKNDHLTATKVVAKIFLNEYNENSIDEALESLLKSCITTPTVILAYHPTTKPTADNEVTTNDKFSWAGDCATSKKNFKSFWTKLQAAAAAGKIRQLGIADMDLETILEVFDDKKFDFTILQINISTCCVVPPELQQFCKDHEIQLLTHSDPQEIFPATCLEEIKLVNFSVKWIVRYLCTLVDRGILAEKGFIVNFRKNQK